MTWIVDSWHLSISRNVAMSLRQRVLQLVTGSDPTTKELKVPVADEG